MEFSGWLTATVFLPLAGALAIATVVRGDRNVRLFAMAIALADLALTIIVFVRYDLSAGAEQVQLVDKIESWIPIEAFKVEYFLGVDGLSAPMVLLTGLLGMVAIFASWGIQSRVRRHLTSARSDVIANRQIDVWEIAFVWAWPVSSPDQLVPLEAHLFTDSTTNEPS